MVMTTVFSSLMLWSCLMFGELRRFRFKGSSSNVNKKGSSSTNVSVDVPSDLGSVEIFFIIIGSIAAFFLFLWLCAVCLKDKKDDSAAAEVQVSRDPQINEDDTNRYLALLWLLSVLPTQSDANSDNNDQELQVHPNLDETKNKDNV